MNALNMLRAHHAEAEIDAAVWIDNHARLGRAVRFLAHHRALRAAVLAMALLLLAIPAAVLAVRETGRLIDRTHEVAGEGTDPCRSCVTAEADEFAASGDLTYEDFCHALDLGDAL